MTRYRLPEALGGGEHEEYRHVDGGTEAPTGTVAFLVAGALVCVAHVLLKRVLPEPPPLWATVAVGDRGRVFQHQPRGSLSAYSTPGDEDDYTWAEVYSYGTPILLVPAPEPVELPWTSNGVHVQQTTDEGKPSNQVYVSTQKASYGFAHLKPADAREMARALWSAADAAEARS